jgi:nephrocystin-4
VFEVHISNPTELSVITRMDEYRALRAANARFFGSPTQPVGHLEQELMAGNRIYLQVRRAVWCDVR